jgi:hypothetical protein
MKLSTVALLLATGAAAIAPAPLVAESSYWDQRWRSREATPEYRRYERRNPVEVRIRKAPRRHHGDDPHGYARRSYNGPVYESQDEVRQSVYEFATGGFGNIKSYR